METHKKITVTGVLSEGIGLGIKNAVSMLGATVLWLLTIWIPYLNVGTTIAMNTIPIELSKGKVISPLFIFDGKYRKYMGEYFTLIGLMYLAIIPALFFMIIPGIIISIGWSLAIYILLDKGVAPGEAMICAFLKNVDLINNRLVIVFSSFKFSKKLLFMLLIFFFFLS